MKPRQFLRYSATWGASLALGNLFSSYARDPIVTGFDYAPGAILAIAGGGPLGGNPDRVDGFYSLGVRMITLMHYRNNELGDIMIGWGGRKGDPIANGLTSAGRNVVKRMQDLGMMVDVA